MFGNYDYASDWTRRRVSEARSRTGTDLDLGTELGSNLSRSTAAPIPKIQRLSFARHPSVVGSAIGTTPIIEKLVKQSKQPVESGVDFRTLTTKTPSKLLSFQNEQPLDVQAILDGRTSKSYGFSSFKRFLHDPPPDSLNDLDTVQKSWLRGGAMLVEFLLAFRKYAEEFSKLTLNKRSLSPHPFELLCVINAKGSHFQYNLPRPVLNSNTSPEIRSYSINNSMNGGNDLLIESAQAVRLNDRRVNWAASVSSKSRTTTGFDHSGNPLSANQPETSILKPSRVVSNVFSTLSSTTISDAPTGIHPQLQPLRANFDELISKYLGSTKPQPEQKALLVEFGEIGEESIERALLEARYTNHPAVLAGVAEDILGGLNLYLLPVFQSCVTSRQQNKKKSMNYRMICGLLCLLFSLVMHTLMIIVPSPLMAPFHVNRRIPSTYRLILLPTLLIGALLVLSDRFNICCFRFWKRIDCCNQNSGPSAPSGYDIKPTDGLEKLSRDSMNSSIVANYHEKRDGEKREKTLTWIASSVIMSLVIQIIFVFIPFIGPP